MSDLSSLALKIEGQKHGPCRLTGEVNALPSCPPVWTVKMLVRVWGGGSVDKLSAFGFQYPCKSQAVRNASITPMHSGKSRTGRSLELIGWIDWLSSGFCEKPCLKTKQKPTIT